MTLRYAIAVLSAYLAVLMLAAALAADRLFLAWVVTMFFFVAAAMGTDAKLEEQVEEPEREEMICAEEEKARAVVFLISRDELRREVLWMEGTEEDA